MLGKTLILGDSYSTFSGYNPVGYDVWYSTENNDNTDVCKVSQTWWYDLFDGKENVLLLNDSFSGATICNSVRPCHSIDASFINRFDKIVSNGFFEENTVDTILIFGGTNDSWINCPVGKCMFENFNNNELLKVLPACGYLAKRINTCLPNAKVCWLVNSDLKAEIEQGIIDTAKHFGQDYIIFTNIDKKSGHPSISGMKQIAKIVKHYFK